MKKLLKQIVASVANTEFLFYSGEFPQVADV